MPNLEDQTAEERRKEAAEQRAQEKHDLEVQREQERRADKEAQAQRAEQQRADRAAEEQRKTSAAQRKAALDALKNTRTGQFGKRAVEKLLTLVELAAVGGIIYLFRHSLERFAQKVAVDIYKGAKFVADNLKTASADVEATEKRIRADIRARYYEDPILGYKLGPQLYNNLILAGGWDTTIYHPEGYYPSGVADTFIAGTGRGAEQLRGSIIQGLSVQHLALANWFIGNSADLSQIGRFELEG